MIIDLITLFVKLGLGGAVDKALNHLEKRAELENDKEKIKSLTTVEMAKEAVKEAQLMTDFNKEKLKYDYFWILLFAAAAPFIFWEWAVVMDSIPYVQDLFGDRQVANLPTQQLQDAFASMVKWTFYVGSGVGAIKFLGR